MSAKKKTLNQGEIKEAFLMGRDVSNSRLKSEGGSLWYKTRYPPVYWMELARWDTDGRCVWLLGEHRNNGPKMIVNRLDRVKDGVPKFLTLDFDNPVESARVLIKEWADWRLKQAWRYRYEFNNGGVYAHASSVLEFSRTKAQDFHDLFGGPHIPVTFNAKVLRKLANQGTEVPLRAWALACEEE